MTDLFNEFLRCFQIAEGVDATSFKPSRLKHGLCTAYPQLLLHRPNVQAKRGMVYVSDLVDEHMTLKTLHNEELDCNSNNSQSLHTNEIHVLYNAAIILHNIIQSKPATKENNFQLHLFTIKSMLPWFFVADPVHYTQYESMY